MDVLYLPDIIVAYLRVLQLQMLSCGTFKWEDRAVAQTQLKCIVLLALVHSQGCGAAYLCIDLPLLIKVMLFFVGYRLVVYGNGYYSHYLVRY